MRILLTRAFHEINGPGCLDTINICRIYFILFYFTATPIYDDTLVNNKKILDELVNNTAKSKAIDSFFLFAQ